MAPSLLDPADTFATLCKSIGLDTRLRKALARLGYIRPTLVQSKCLPLAITSGRDLLVRARTGTGKTLCYCLPILHKILLSSSTTGVKAVVLVPSGELRAQVHKTLVNLTYYCRDVVTIAVLSGTANNGESSKSLIAQQEAMLRDRPNIIVSTPAGLLTHVRSGALTLKDTVESLVVDEADLVLSFGYSNDITEIMKSLPKICQGFLMSATLSPELTTLKRVVLHSPAVLKLEEEDERKVKSSNEGKLVQFYLSLSKKDKYLVIYVFLKLGLLKGKGLFFVNTTDGGYRLKLFLEQFHIRSAVLNAELPLKSRLNIIEQFNIGNFDYLIATDESTDAAAGSTATKKNDEENGCVDDEEKKKPKKKRRASKKDSEYGVSRGLDFCGVSFVVNVDFPPSKQSYTHRIGRTARGRSSGVALSLVETESSAQLEILQEVQAAQPPIPTASQGATNNVLQSAPNVVEDELNRTKVQTAQPTPLDFNLSEIEGFRYRVEDVSRAVTKIAVRETRAAELRAEILNSERMQSHFEENPADLQLLRHDRFVTHVAKVQDHLKHVPTYMLPRGMQVAELNKKRKKRRFKNNHDKRGLRRKDNDPLQSFNGGDVTLDGVVGETVVPTDHDKFFDDGDDDASDGLGHSTSGRSAWQAKHKKGKFSKKRKNKNFDEQGY